MLAFWCWFIVNGGFSLIPTIETVSRIIEIQQTCFLPVWYFKIMTVRLSIEGWKLFLKQSLLNFNQDKQNTVIIVEFIITK